MVKDILVSLLIVFTAPIWIPFVLLVLSIAVALVLYLVAFILLLCSLVWYPFM